MAKVYDTATDLITFARLQAQNTTSGSSYLGSDGLLKFAAEDEPRIEYGSDGSLKGLLIEEQRTNLVTYSEDFSQWPTPTNGSWSSSDAWIDGSSGNLATANGSGYFEARLGLGSGATASTATTMSVWLKDNGLGPFTLRMRESATVANSCNAEVDLSSETVSVTVAGTFTSGSGTIEKYQDGWFRVSLTATIGTSTSLEMRLYKGGTPTGGIYIHGAQLEVGSFATSYIPTSGSQSTRSPDIASIPVSAFGYNQTAGTWVVDYSTFNTYTGSPYPRVMALSDGYSPREGLEILSFNNITNAAGYSNGSSTFSFVGPPSVKTAFAAKENNFAGSFGGGSVLTDVTGAMSTASLLEIGKYSGSAYLNGHIKSLSYFPRRLTNAQLQELTS